MGRLLPTRKKEIQSATGNAVEPDPAGKPEIVRGRTTRGRGPDLRPAVRAVGKSSVSV